MASTDNLDKIDLEKLNEEQRKEVVELLYEAMMFWRNEGSKHIKNLIFQLNKEGAGRVAADIAKLFKDADDRWIDIAVKIAPYYRSKLANVTINKKIEHRFVIEAPAIVPDKRAWLESVAEQQALLPKTTVIDNINGTSEIDEAEYLDVNAD